MTGSRRWVLTAALFAGALVLLLVAVVTHSGIPLFVMWAPLLLVPVVLGKAEAELHRRPAEHTDVDRGRGPDATDADRG